MAAKKKLTEETQPSSSADTLWKDQYDYAWKYFSYHANQRTVVFNFFLITVGLILNAFVQAYGDFNNIVPMFIALSGLLLCVAFMKLDQRNEHLLSYARNVLTYLENEVIFKSDVEVKIPNKVGDDEKRKVGIFKIQDIEQRQRGKPPKNSHGKWMRIIQFGLMGIFGLLLLFVPLESFFDLSSVFPNEPAEASQCCCKICE
jgi:hypothetical protein